MRPCRSNLRKFAPNVLNLAISKVILLNNPFTVLFSRKFFQDFHKKAGDKNQRNSTLCAIDLDDLDKNSVKSPYNVIPLLSRMIHFAKYLFYKAKSTQHTEQVQKTKVYGLIRKEFRENYLLLTKSIDFTKFFKTFVGHMYM